MISDVKAADATNADGQVAPRERTWRRYSEFLGRRPETVVEWNDPETSARGWLVVNRFKGGAAGGGTRMREGLTRDEVEYLAKVMELKFSVSGPSIGGAKSGIDFDPRDSRKKEVLGRWFEAIKPLLETRYSTAGDLNVDEVREVGPACARIGIAHPQLGLARGHLGLEGAELEERLDVVREGLGQSLNSELGLEDSGLRLADMVTGFGVATTTTRLLEHQGRTLDGARLLLEGFGRVGGAAALYLSRWGGSIVGIVDVRRGLVAENGLTVQEVEALLRTRDGNELPKLANDAISTAARERFRDTPADIVICAASSGTVGTAELERFERQGVEMIVSGANRPFTAAYPGDTEVEREADRRLAIIPDFIANCGTAHAFAYQMHRSEPATAAEIYDSVEMTVCGALDEAVALAGRTDRGLLAAALEAALDRCAA